MSKNGVTNILMLGWEFPPHIAGGLGVACHGLVKGLHDIGRTRVKFVMPNVSGEEDGRLAQFLSVYDSANGSRHAPQFKAGIPTLPWSTDASSGEGGLDAELMDYLYTVMDSKELEIYRDEVERERTVLAAKGDRVAGKFLRAYLRNLIRPALAYAINIERVLEKAGPIDVIHAHDWFTYFAGVKAKRLTGKPLVAHVHSTEVDRSMHVDISIRNMNISIYSIERFGLSMADRIIAVSNKTKKTVVDNYEAGAEKIDTIYNAVEPMAYSSSGDRLTRAESVVTFIGRITYQKGPIQFIKAASTVLKVKSDVKFVMAGSGDQLNTAKSLVTSLGLVDNFEFPGFLSAEGVRDLLAVSDVYVMPSISEPFGITALEALDANVPIVVSAQSGVAEVVSSAFKVNAEDITDISNAILYVLNHPEEAMKSVQRGRQEANGLHWNRSAAQLADVYESVCVGV